MQRLLVIVVLIVLSSSSSSYAEESSPPCFGHGTVQDDGVCHCEAHYFGRNCECSGHEVATENECRPSGGGIVCNGRGSCQCGHCMCLLRENPDEVVSGTYCECDNFSCDRIGGLLCSGRHRGRCECGTCRCNPGFSGTACDSSVE